jgi:DNA-binding beta-propeller fold protein YncE
MSVTEVPTSGGGGGEGLAGPQGGPPTPGDGDKTTRRILKALLVLLVVAAVALLFLLLWLLRPKSSLVVGPNVSGYPIKPVSVIYGFGNEQGQLLKGPLGVAFDSAGNVWISDTGNSRVLEFTSGGQYIRTVGDSSGPGQLAAPYGIAIDPSLGRVYVADYNDRALKMYSTSTGQYIGSFPAPGAKRGTFGPVGFTPFAVAVVDGRVIASSNDGLYFFDTNGHVIASWNYYKNGGGPGKNVGQMNFPDSFSVDTTTATIYVADTLNKRIIALNSEGKWLWVQGTPDSETGQSTGFWQLPRSIVYGSDGKLYVVDTFRYSTEGVGVGNFVVMSKTGQFLSEFGKAGSTDDAFSFPNAVAERPDGLFAVADRANNRVVLFRLTSPLPPPNSLESQKWTNAIDVSGTSVYMTPSPSPVIQPSPAPTFHSGGGLTGILWIMVLLLIVLGIAVWAYMRRTGRQSQQAESPGGGAASAEAEAVTATTEEGGANPPSVQSEATHAPPEQGEAPEQGETR